MSPQSHDNGCCAAPPAAPIRIPLLSDGGGTPPPPPPFPYRDWPCLCGTIETSVGPVPQVSTTLTFADRRGGWAMRWGIGRNHYRIRPGLYAIGNPDAAAPVLVSANYKLSFDALRRELGGSSCWLLILDTRGINVWCAAGKGTFGTAEVVRQVTTTRLERLVSHRTLILPQLGAVGVAAHEVRQRCGFKVVYGPVRASDLPAYLAAGQVATTAMRRVTFTLAERLVLTPVELTALRREIMWGIPLLFLLGGLGPGFFSVAAATTRGGNAILTGFAGLFCGALATPLLLPWLPGRAFAAKGGLLALLLGSLYLGLAPQPSGWLATVAFLAPLAAVASYCAMNFTGASTFTSPSGVEKEMRRYLPLQGAALLLGAGCWLAGALLG